MSNKGWTRRQGKHATRYFVLDNNWQHAIHHIPHLSGNDEFRVGRKTFGRLWEAKQYVKQLLEKAQ